MATAVLSTECVSEAGLGEVELLSKYNARNTHQGGPVAAASYALTPK